MPNDRRYGGKSIANPLICWLNACKTGPRRVAAGPNPRAVSRPNVPPADRKPSVIERRPRIFRTRHRARDYGRGPRHRVLSRSRRRSVRSHGADLCLDLPFGNVLARYFHQTSHSPSPKNSSVVLLAFHDPFVGASARLRQQRSISASLLPAAHARARCAWLCELVHGRSLPRFHVCDDRLLRCAGNL